MKRRWPRGGNRNGMSLPPPPGLSANHQTSVPSQPKPLSLTQTIIFHATSHTDVVLVIPSSATQTIILQPNLHPSNKLSCKPSSLKQPSSFILYWLNQHPSHFKTNHNFSNKLSSLTQTTICYTNHHPSTKPSLTQTTICHMNHHSSNKPSSLTQTIIPH